MAAICLSSVAAGATSLNACGATARACACSPNGSNADGFCGHPRLMEPRRSRRRNWAISARAFRNVPCGESDESSVEVIEVLDPCHPLCGRTFRVIRRVDRGSGNFSPSYEVEYLQNHSLLVPISVTEAYNKKANQTKLSIEALRDLVLTVECLESHEHGSEGSVGSAAASSAASDCRGCRRGSGGGLS